MRLPKIRLSLGSTFVVLLVVTPIVVVSAALLVFLTLFPHASSLPPATREADLQVSAPSPSPASSPLCQPTLNASYSADFIPTNETVELVLNAHSAAGNDSNSGPLPLGQDIGLDQAVVNATPTELVQRDIHLEKIEARLAKARKSIAEAALVTNLTSVHQDPDYVPKGPIYWNANSFHRSYLEMEKHFKIYVYEEGDVPLFHYGPYSSIYSSEGMFIHEMERGKLYRTRDPHQAFVYFLPFSVVMMVEYIYKPECRDNDGFKRPIVDYINLISSKHPFWNRSLGADHVMLSCHDWGPLTSASVPNLFTKSIRVFCNANTSEGFNPTKDASFPEINIKTWKPKQLLGGYSPSQRSILAFFAGRLHGDIRYLLLQEWKNKDQDVRVYEELPKGVSYEEMMKKSKFCLCPSGYEVASPRIVEAIYAECVPVLISDAYIPPYSDVLNWAAFSVQVKVKDIAKIKEILMGISDRQYLRLQRRVKQVQRHFVMNDPPKRFDVFHMTVHSIWLRRLNVRFQDYPHPS